MRQEGSSLMIQAERSLHTEIMMRLTSPLSPVIAIPIPNSVYIPAHSDAERRVVAQIITRMKSDGMLLPGAPDIVTLWEGGCGVIELKKPATRDLFGRRSPAGRPSAAQKEFAALCAEHGVRHAYCHSWDEVRAALVEWGRLV